MEKKPEAKETVKFVVVAKVEREWDKTKQPTFTDLLKATRQEYAEMLKTNTVLLIAV